jgi:hypothetical protein
MEEGFGLVTARNNPMNLTDKGRALAFQLERNMRK